MASIFTVLKKQIVEDMEQLQNVLLSNRIESMDHYRYLTGQLRGLTVSLNRVKDLEAKLQNEDWED